MSFVGGVLEFLTGFIYNQVMRYNPKQIESKWKKEWEKRKIYEPDFKKATKPFYNLMMFPYPSAEGLHIGAVRTFSGIDIYGRFKRMQGYDVFEPIGLDGFGIHSENYALKIGKHPIQHAKDSEKNFYRQLSEIGNGFAWRERLETYDPEYYKWTQWIFVQMFKRGLAYRKKAPVNWCPSCKTVLSDEQVVTEKCERCDSEVIKKELEQWFFKITDYAERLLKNLDKIDWSERIKIAQKNWIGKSEGAEIVFPLKPSFNYVFLHGYLGSPDTIFWPWLKNQLEKQGARVYAPQLPHASEPNIEEQVNFVLKNYNFDAKTIIVTHSLGGVVALKLLSRLRTKVAKVVMVVPPLRTKFLDGKRKRPLERATDWKFNFAGARSNADSFVVIRDIHDQVVPSDQPIEIARNLHAKLVEVVAPESHFNCPEAPTVLDETVFVIKVFTTRPDTLFGATYMVIAPEHTLIANSKSQVTNYKEVSEYIEKAKAKIEEERVAKGKDHHLSEDSDGRGKTGVELKGIKAINPATKEEIPIWVADYVLGHVGTGAIMAVPAHDQRDFEFAKKFKLSIEHVIMPFFEDEMSKRRDGFKNVKRKTIYAILRNPRKKEYLVLDWSKYNWHTFVIGGVEDREDAVAAATREITEETGYSNIRFVKSLGRQIGAYFAAHKNENRIADAEGLLFELIDEKRTYIDSEHSKNHKVLWLKEEEVANFVNISSQQYAWEQFQGKSAYSGDGILINSGKFDEMDSLKAKWEITKFVGGEKKIQYRLRDWLVSRQRYWGPPIPMIFCKKCSWQAVPEKDLPVKLPYIKNFRPTGTDQSPLATVEKFYKVRCPKCREWARRETDVSDAFLDSAWYYLRYPSVKESRKPWNPAIIKKWLPVDMYIGGAEHSVLHLMYSRFVAMAFRDWGFVNFEEPFTKFRTHGLILKDGAKMSKSRGNVVNPDEYIKAYGADAIRMYLAFLSSLTQDGDFRDTGIRGLTKFLERVWKFGQQKSKIPPLRGDARSTSGGKNQKLQRVVHRTIKKATEDIESLQYNTAISALMVLLNEFEANENDVSEDDWKIFLKILAPFAPFTTEELWHEIPNQERKYISIHNEKWPEYNPKLIREDTFELVVQVNGKFRGRVTLPVGASEVEAKKAALAEASVKQYVQKGPRRVIFVPNRLINFVV
ncbi:MAG: hypothetical protein A3C07_00210 [Candidatus Sungbacteria bacterium RIFCSPHIGHO2_02_FULL_47_11]|uniref:Leucine--tRNA ligase n=1 Tax=Candidatus Sungbacteria bacterium RIFCSPHIGHO2_02_FULL_47_11 TaxID=1802270 RepID=A0A1G2KNH2_9BACT|nr:MAG: hypothetical protein A3C07_00210 [Candidatus Sungbacteria bacterium RIFCSPHIGHO2_02_FULL_47_11]